MEPDDEDKGKNPNLATTLASIAIDTAKLITGVPLDYPDPLLTPLATVPQPAKEEPVMDDEKEKPMVDQMTDVVADEIAEWENEQWPSSFAGAGLPNNLPYTIQRRPAPVSNSREITLPASAQATASQYFTIGSSHR